MRNTPLLLTLSVRGLHILVDFLIFLFFYGFYRDRRQGISFQGEIARKSNCLIYTSSGFGEYVNKILSFYKLGTLI